jgi:transcriptional regulator with XRE-family HTH domain
MVLKEPCQGGFMQFDKKLFGEKIRYLRHSNRITLEELAKMLGITRSALGNIENGRKGASIEVICCLANHFDVSIDYLLGRTNNPMAHKSKSVDENHSL